MIGVPVSTLVGYVAAGWLNEAYGWRITFLLLGLPGLVLAVVALTLREPRQLAKHPVSGEKIGGNACIDQRAPVSPSSKEVWVALWRNQTFRNLLIAFSVMSFFGNGLAKWQPVFFIRSHGLQTGEIGTWLGVIYGVAGIIGMFGGGELAARFASNNEQRQLRWLAIVFSFLAVIWMLVYLSAERVTAFAWLGVAALGGAATNGPLFATIQTLFAENMRASAVAVLYLFANLIGMGLGPLAAGVMSDAFRPVLGDESLRVALICLCPGYLWGGWHVWRASRSVMSDLLKVSPS
jgi:MFS family permease